MGIQERKMRYNEKGIFFSQHDDYDTQIQCEEHYRHDHLNTELEAESPAPALAEHPIYLPTDGLFAEVCQVADVEKGDYLIFPDGTVHQVSGRIPLKQGFVLFPCEDGMKIRAGETGTLDRMAWAIEAAYDKIVTGKDTPLFTSERCDEVFASYEDGEEFFEFQIQELNGDFGCIEETTVGKEFENFATCIKFAQREAGAA